MTGRPHPALNLGRPGPEPPRVARVVSALTGHGVTAVVEVLSARAIYLGSLGLCAESELPPGTDLEAEVAQRPELFPPEHRAGRLSSWELEAEFVTQRADLPYRYVLEILLAESACSMAVGAMEPEAYVARRAWVQDQLPGGLTPLSADDRS
jgi:hypothetical protein